MSAANPECYIAQMENIIAGIKDTNLKLTLAFGIGIHHAGLHERDRKSVEELFVNQKIQVSACNICICDYGTNHNHNNVYRSVHIVHAYANNHNNNNNNNLVIYYNWKQSF